MVACHSKPPNSRRFVVLLQYTKEPPPAPAHLLNSTMVPRAHSNDFQQGGAGAAWGGGAAGGGAAGGGAAGGGAAGEGAAEGAPFQSKDLTASVRFCPTLLC